MYEKLRKIYEKDSIVVNSPTKKDYLGSSAI